MELSSGHTHTIWVYLYNIKVFKEHFSSWLNFLVQSSRKLLHKINTINFKPTQKWLNSDPFLFVEQFHFGGRKIRNTYGTWSKWYWDILWLKRILYTTFVRKKYPDHVLLMLFNVFPNFIFKVLSSWVSWYTNYQCKVSRSYFFALEKQILYFFNSV